MSLPSSEVSCPNCGAVFQVSAEVEAPECEACGQLVPSHLPSAPAHGAPFPLTAPEQAPLPRICQCGAQADPNAVTCPQCKRAFRPAILGIVSILGLVLTPIFALVLLMNVQQLQDSQLAITDSDRSLMSFLESIGIVLNIWLFTIWLRLLRGKTGAWYEANWALGIGLLRHWALNLLFLSITRAWAGMSLPMDTLSQMLAMFLVTALLAAMLHSKAVKSYCNVS
ncbi:MAG: hypothetical protein BWY76_01916 [bacterium ADurb.Bin429]|nr:MAG: hypothetical protein BWY76_01916 [bacterium ADurb.Bin429]